MIDVTDATFEADVIARSHQVPVVVDLWAPWCGPCRQLGPLLEEAETAAAGAVVLAKVNVDENPQVSAAFQVQSIPAVYALKDGKVVDGFVGAVGRGEVEAFMARLAPTEEDLRKAALLEAGDEASLRTLIEEEPGHEEAITALAALLIERGDREEALDLLNRIPESEVTRHLAALARAGDELGDDPEQLLAELLDRVKQDDAARQEFVDVLELLGPQHPRAAEWRRKLTAALF